jgi:diguanylate cyclase (GGDEF)-like protein
VSGVSVIEEPEGRVPATAAPDVVLTVAEGILTGWNATAGALFGLTDADRGRPVDQVLKPGSETAQIAAELQRERMELASEATELWHRAFHDPLTNLANRHLLRERASSALDRGPDAILALLLVELDVIKAVNDALGHTIGDQLLGDVAQRLIKTVEGRGTVARPGGGFAVLLDDVANDSDARAVAAAIIEGLSEPFELDSRVLFVSPRIGIVVTDGTYSDVDTLLRNADVALFHARGRDGGAFVCFESTMHTAALNRLELEADLRAALQRDELVLQYQPIAALRSGQILGVEALVRWKHPVRGMVPPIEFIPLAEETGLVIALGEWVLREACRQTVAWHRSHPDRPPVSVAVNLAGSQLQLTSFAATVAQILRETGLRPADLVLEITESQIMDNIDAIIPNLHQLQELGVRLSIDDFGTGYSSLSRLRSLPVDELKIDRSFVNEIQSGADEAPLVAAIIAMAHGLDLKVVGEGVETAEQLDFLLRSGCDKVQGYLLGRPVSADIIDTMISQPVLVLRLAAAAAVLGSAGDKLDGDISEALSGLLADAGTAAELVDGLLALVSRATGLDAAYLTQIDWTRKQQTVVGVHGPCDLKIGDNFSWVGNAPDVYGDGRRLVGRQTYISVPVLGASGGLLGTLFGTSEVQRSLNRSQLAAMEVLAGLLGGELAQEPSPIQVAS